MQHAQELESVRRIVRSTLDHHGASSESRCQEKILVRDGFYCGRCFTCEGYRAIWFIEEHVVKFYGPEGGYLCKISTDDSESERDWRRVA